MDQKNVWKAKGVNSGILRESYRLILKLYVGNWLPTFLKIYTECRNFCNLC